MLAGLSCDSDSAQPFEAVPAASYLASSATKPSLFSSGSSSICSASFCWMSRCVSCSSHSFYSILRNFSKVNSLEWSGLELPDVVVAIEASRVISLPPLPPSCALGLILLPSKDVLTVVW
jgi:hypothetical protein